MYLISFRVPLSGSLRAVNKFIKKDNKSFQQITNINHDIDLFFLLILLTSQFGRYVKNYRK